MTSTSVHSFLERLARSGLLHGDELERAANLAEQQGDAERSALQLVERNYLTRWQARQLLSNRSPRFFIGHYKLLKELGRGSMGTVYRALHPTMSRIVALKVMAPDFLKDRRAVARFQREIRTAAALDHPHIVRALDAGCEKNDYYLVMEHIEGKDLRHWIQRAGPLPIPWSCECIRQAAVGLQHAFERGITHRDMKPSNLLVCGDTLDAEPLVKIVDFGLARVGEDLGEQEKLTRVGRTVGTWEFMAPEQSVDSSRADTRSDIFGLGCALFQMVSGELPYQGKSDVDSLMMRLKSEAPRLSTRRTDIDPWLDDIVATMLARDPARRFQTPMSLAQALASAPLPKRSEAPVLVLPQPAKPPHAAPASLTPTDPEFDQFLQTSSDISARSSSVTRLVRERQPPAAFWTRWALPALVSLAGLLAFAAWVRFR